MTIIIANNCKFALALPLLLTMLTACGGGGSDGGTPPPEPIIRVSIDSAGNQVTGSSRLGLSRSAVVSSKGRYVVFLSDARDLVAADTGAMTDVFLHDIQTSTTTRMSVDSAGVQATSFDNTLLNASMSSNGRYITFNSDATNLVSDDTNGVMDVFVRDTVSNTTVRVSVDGAGIESNNFSSDSSISAEGRFVVFQSAGSNLVAADNNNKFDIFVHDTQTRDTTRVSVNSVGTEGSSISLYPVFSDDGRYVAFGSNAINLVANDINASGDIFVHDTQTGITTRVSVNSAGVEANGSTVGRPSISANGRYVAFSSGATNLVISDTNSTDDVFLHDTQTGETIRVSVNSGGIASNGLSNLPSISSDGRYVVYASSATNLVAGDTNGVTDIFVYDKQTGDTRRASVDGSGAESNGVSNAPGFSSDGRYVVFDSSATNLVAGDTNAVSDIFRAPNPFLVP